MNANLVARSVNEPQPAPNWNPIKGNYEVTPPYDVTPPYGEYSFMFSFEENFHYPSVRQWMQDHWTLSVWISCAYIGFVFSVQRFMASRDKFDLRKSLVAWNASLALFSIVGTIRCLPEMTYVLEHYGLQYSCCVPSCLEVDKVTSFWAFAFILSKVPELGDTLFIVLRKSPLLFLQWYHHTTVLVFSWYAYKEGTTVARWFVMMNFIIHSLMYAYFALRAARVRLPPRLPLLITTLQLLQMCVGVAVNVRTLQYLKSDTPCANTVWTVCAALLMYASYFALFLRFFVRAYIYKLHSSHIKTR